MSSLRTVEPPSRLNPSHLPPVSQNTQQPTHCTYHRPKHTDAISSRSTPSCRTAAPPTSLHHPASLFPSPAAGSLQPADPTRAHRWIFFLLCILVLDAATPRLSAGYKRFAAQ